MTKQKVRILIPLVITSGFIVYSWTKILATDDIATWQHYIALGLFAMLVILYFKNIKSTIIATGIYLILGTFTLLSLTPGISKSWLRIGPIETPHVNLLSLGLFVLYFILNQDHLIDMYLDYKETRQKRNNENAI